MNLRTIVAYVVRGLISLSILLSILAAAGAPSKPILP
jgi:hypothetical protein